MNNENCQQTILVLEGQLARKSRQLNEQVMYNSLTLILGLVLGFVFAKTYKFVSFGKK